jgi:hypothetical protein
MVIRSDVKLGRAMSDLFASHPEYLALAAGGALMGIILVLNGWSERPPARGAMGELKTSSRARNILWIFGGGAASALFGNWKMVFGKEGINNGNLLAVYIGSFFVAAFLTFLVVILLICLDAASRRMLYAVPQLVNTYLHYGNQGYTGDRDRLREERERRLQETWRQEAEEQKSVERRLTKLARHADVQKTFAALIHATKGQAAKGQGLTSELIEEIMSTICSAAQSLAEVPEGLELRANLMRFVPVERASDQLASAALFRFGDLSRYTGYLVLERPAGRIVLPVETAANADLSLPGAPEAFVTDRSVITNKATISYRPRLPRKTRGDVEAYFARDEFRNCQSITCIIVPTSQEPIGVINLESSREHLVGEGPEVAGRICVALQPFASLLSNLRS